MWKTLFVNPVTFDLKLRGKIILNLGRWVGLKMKKFQNLHNIKTGFNHFNLSLLYMLILYYITT